MARDPATGRQGPANIGELPVYIESEDDRGQDLPVRWRPSRDALVTRAVLIGGGGLAVVIGALLAARGLGPAGAAPTSRLLIGGALVSGVVVGGAGGTWAARWPTARLRAQLATVRPRSLPGPPDRSAPARAARALASAVGTVLLALVTLVVAGGAGYLLGVVAPLITLVDTAGLIAYGLALVRCRYATIDAWERNHPGRTVVQARVRASRFRRATVLDWTAPPG